jgi:hypothetical protein
MNRLQTIAVAVAALGAMQAATPVSAQPAPNAPPSWDALVHCADMTDSAKELECYRTAMRAAGYRRNPEREAAEQRKGFGLSLPKFGPSKPEKGAAVAAAPGTPTAEPPKADANVITVTVAEVAYMRPLNQLLIVTTDGAVWAQNDTEPVNFEPKRGQTVTIRRTPFGGYFCDFGRSNAVRCERRN